MISFLQIYLDDAINVSTINLNCNLTSSANDLLVECIEYLYSNLLLSRSVNESNIPKKQYRETVIESSGDLLKKFYNLYHQSHEKRSDIMIIILRYADKLLGNILNDFAVLLHEHLAGFTSIRIIAVYSDFVPLPPTPDRSLHGRIELSHSVTASPFDLFDEIMTRVLAAQEIPVLLPPAAISWIYETFCRNDCCILNALDK